MKRRLAPIHQKNVDGSGVVAAGGEIGLRQRFVGKRAGDLGAGNRKTEPRCSPAPARQVSVSRTTSSS
jgi:hypothetical protein